MDEPTAAFATDLRFRLLLCLLRGHLHTRRISRCTKQWPLAARDWGKLGSKMQIFDSTCMRLAEKRKEKNCGKSEHAKSQRKNETLFYLLRGYVRNYLRLCATASPSIRHAVHSWFRLMDSSVAVHPICSFPKFRTTNTHSPSYSTARCTIGHIFHSIIVDRPTTEPTDDPQIETIIETAFLRRAKSRKAQQRNCSATSP